MAMTRRILVAPSTSSLRSYYSGDSEETVLGLSKSSPQIRRLRVCVLAASAVFLTLQLLALFSTVIFYLYASSETYRNSVARYVITRLYAKEMWNYLRRNRSLEFHILVSLAVQLLFLLPSGLLVYAASKRLKFLMLPWLILFGIFQFAMVVLSVAMVVYLPERTKILSLHVALAEALVLFPWWYSVLHLFSALPSNEENYKFSYHPTRTASTGGRSASTATRSTRRTTAAIPSYGKDSHVADWSFGLATDHDKRPRLNRSKSYSIRGNLSGLREL